MSNSTLDDVLKKFTYENLYLLQRFRETPNFQAVADQIGSDERTVKRHLLGLNDAFRETRKAAIIEQRGSRGWVITTAGAHLVSYLKDSMDALRTAPDLVAGTAANVMITSSRNGLRQLGQLRAALPTPRDWDIHVNQKRTAEIWLGEDEGTQLYFLSLLKSMESIEIEPHDVVQLPDGIEFVALSVEPIRLLAPRSIGAGPVRTIREHLERNVVFAMPTGGVVWDYVNKNWPGWAGLRPAQHRVVSDREAGLKLLSFGLATHGAMLVHGFDLDAARLAFDGLQDFEVFDLADDDRRWRAITGLFWVKRDDFDSDTISATKVVWEKAVELWGRGE